MKILRGRLYEKNKFIGFINMCVSVNELSSLHALIVM